MQASSSSSLSHHTENETGDIISGDPLSTTLTRHPSLWFFDGSIILRADHTLFKVHISQLTRQSKFFKGMFALAQPDQPEPAHDIRSTHIQNGCPTLEMYDDVEDVANLLAAMYDGPTFGTNDREDFQLVSGILRLSTKYEVDKLRTKALAHLGVAWPSTLKAWDAREELARAYEAETSVDRRMRYPSPAAVINLAREVDAPELLPSAFYALSRFSFNELYGHSPHESIRDDIHLLGSFDMQCLALGKENAQQVIPALIQSMGNSNKNQRDYGMATPYEQARPIRQRSSGSVCISAALCRDDLAELVQLATQHYLVEHGKGYTDPLYVAEELGQLKSAEVSDCKACSKSLEQWASKERERMWKLIPQWFQLTQEDNSRRAAKMNRLAQERLKTESSRTKELSHKSSPPSSQKGRDEGGENMPSTSAG